MNFNKEGMSSILEMVSSGKLTPLEAAQEILKQKEDALYYYPYWSEKTINAVEVNEAENILYIGRDSRMKAELEQISARRNIVTIMPSLVSRKKSDVVYEIDFKEKDELAAAIREIACSMKFPSNIIVQAEKETMESVEYLYELLFLTQVLMEEKVAHGIQLLFVYEGKEAVPELDALDGFFRTLKLENSSFQYKILHFRDTKIDSNILLRELCAKTEQDSMICYENGNRLVLQYDSFYPEREKKASIIHSGDTVLITGGTGNIAKILAMHLMKKFQCRIVLTGRRECSRQMEETLRELKKFGSAVYIKGDVTSRTMMSQILKENHIDGVIHCAGVIEDEFILRKEKENVEKVLAPKVTGIKQLYLAMIQSDAEYLISFSSMASVFGNVGQMDYAYANAFMDSFSRENSGKNKITVCSINWPLWEEGGMSIDRDKTKILEERLGIHSISTRLAEDAFDTALTSGKSNLMVLCGNKEKVNKSVDELVNHNGIKEELKDGQREETFIKEITENQAENLRKEVENYLKKILSELTKLPIENIDSRSSFDELGLDSVVIMGLNEKLEQDFEHLSKTLFYEYSNIQDLAGYFVEEQRETAIRKFLKTPMASIQSEERMKNTYVDTIHRKYPHEKHGVKKRGIHHRRRSSIKKGRDIAIVGLSGEYPMSENLKALWENLTEGNDCITEIPRERWDWRKYYDPDMEQAQNGKMYTKNGGFIKNFDQFDPLFFSISPLEAQMMDPQERRFVETAFSALEDAGLVSNSMHGILIDKEYEDTGVFVGVTTNTYNLWAPEQWERGNMITPNAFPWSIANRVSYLFNLHGPSMAFDTACSSSLIAVHNACESIRKGECKQAVAGGVNLYLHPLKFVSMCKMRMLSPSGVSSSFGIDADGFVPGEGVGAIVLKPLEDAEKNGDFIYGVIKGSAINHGGKTNGFTVPNPAAQGEVIKQALLNAQVNPRDISYIETHGTGTILGDPIEISGLTKAFSEYTDEKQFCAIGSIKSNMGHAEAAAGIAGITKILLQMKYGKLVPSIHSEVCNPNIDFSDTPFFVQHSLTEWKRPVITDGLGERKERKRIAGISSFGAGGSNAHIIIEEYMNYVDEAETQKKEYLIPLSAESEEQLKDYVKTLKNYVEDQNSKNFIGSLATLNNLSYTLCNYRRTWNNRCAFVVKDKEDLITKLTAFLNGSRMEESFHGNVKKTAKSEEGKRIKEISADSIQVLADTQQLSSMAELWVMGAVVDFKSIFSEKAHRIPCPTYAFAKERYWFETVERVQKRNRQTLHPLIDENVSTFEQQSYQKIFQPEEPFVRDHKIKGSYVLPGAVYLEMAWSGAKFSSNTADVVMLRDVTFRKSKQVTDEPKPVLINFNIDSNVEFEIVTRQNDIKEVHCTGTVVYGKKSDEVKESIMLNELISKCSNQISGTDCYAAFANAGFVYGTFFQCIDTVYIGEGYAIAKLSLSEEKELEEYGLHPGIVDGMLQTAGVWQASNDTERKNGGYVPFTIRELLVTGKFEQTMYAFVEKIPDENESVQSFDIRLVNKQGELKVKVSGFSAHVIGAKKETKKPADKMDLLQQLAEGKIKPEDIIDLYGGV